MTKITDPALLDESQWQVGAQWSAGAMVSWAEGKAVESTDGGKTWRSFTLDMTPCPCCGNPLMRREYLDG